MKKIDNYYETIEKYLTGQMSEEEESHFQGDMDQNKELQRDVQMHNDLFEAIEEDDILDLRQKLTLITRTGKKRKRPVIRYISWSAAASVILVITGLYYFNGFGNRNERIFNNYYEPYPAVSTVRSSNSETGMRLRKALENYEHENYKTAVELSLAMKM